MRQPGLLVDADHPQPTRLQNEPRLHPRDGYPIDGCVCEDCAALRVYRPDATKEHPAGQHQAGAPQHRNA